MEEEVKNMIKLSYTKLNTKLKKRVAVIAAVMCAITVTSGCGSYNAELTWEIEESTVSEEADIESTKTPEEADMICVYVGGAVSDSGVYLLPQGSRLYEAIEAAGGMTEGADPYYLNQAKVLEDAEQIIVLTTQEVQERKQQIQHEEEEAGACEHQYRRCGTAYAAEWNRAVQGRGNRCLSRAVWTIYTDRRHTDGHRY